MSIDGPGRELPRLELRTKYWFEVNGKFAIGEGGVSLLRAIGDTGSLAQAALAIGWSYRHAWGYLRRAESAVGVPLTARRGGKGRNRGLDLTPAASSLVRRDARIRRQRERIGRVLKSTRRKSIAAVD